MEIKYETRHLLDTIHIHDSEFAGYTYDYDRRRVLLSCKNVFAQTRITLALENVILLHLQSCSFWHGGNSILWMTVRDGNDFLDALIRQQHCNAETYRDSYLDQGIRYLTIEFTINSGDTLLIACERVVCSETALLS